MFDDDPYTNFFIVATVAVVTMIIILSAIKMITDAIIAIHGC